MKNKSDELVHLRMTYDTNNAFRQGPEYENVIKAIGAVSPGNYTALMCKLFDTAIREGDTDLVALLISLTDAKAVPLVTTTCMTALCFSQASYGQSYAMLSQMKGLFNLVHTPTESVNIIGSFFCELNSRCSIENLPPILPAVLKSFCDSKGLSDSESLSAIFWSINDSFSDDESFLHDENPDSFSVIKESMAPIMSVFPGAILHFDVVRKLNPALCYVFTKMPSCGMTHEQKQQSILETGNVSDAVAYARTMLMLYPGSISIAMEFLCQIKLDELVSHKHAHFIRVLCHGGVLDANKDDSTLERHSTIVSSIINTPSFSLIVNRTPELTQFNGHVASLSTAKTMMKAGIEPSVFTNESGCLFIVDKLIMENAYDRSDMEIIFDIMKSTDTANMILNSYALHLDAKGMEHTSVSDEIKLKMACIRYQYERSMTKDTQMSDDDLLHFFEGNYYKHSNTDSPQIKNADIFALIASSTMNGNECIQCDPKNSDFLRYLYETGLADKQSMMASSPSSRRVLLEDELGM